MKAKNIIAALIATTLVAAPHAHAEEAPATSTESEYVPSPIHDPDPVPEPTMEDPREYPNVDTLEPPGQDLVAENPWVNSSIDPAINNAENDPASQNEPEIWAIVDENGNTVNTIVCDVDYCGSGWVPTAYDGFTPTQWARVVLQSERDPLTGENNGGHWGQYNFPSNVWTELGSNGATYLVPSSYGDPRVCVENCPVVEQPVGDSPDENVEDVPLNTTNQTDTSSEIQTKNSFVRVTTNKNYFSFKEKVHKKKMIKFGKVWVIAKKDKSKRVWKFDVNRDGVVKIVLPTDYADWEITVNYKLKNSFTKNRKTFSKNIILKN